jgi:hypothetical protein
MLSGRMKDELKQKLRSNIFLMTGIDDRRCFLEERREEGSTRGGMKRKRRLTEVVASTRE